MIQFSGRLKTLREAKGITQSEMARMLSITRNGYNSWEQGFSVASPAHLVNLSRIYGVSINYLLGDDNCECLNVNGLNDKDVAILAELASRLKGRE